MCAGGCVDRIGVYAALEDRGVMACRVLVGRFSMAYTVADRLAFCICSIKLHIYFLRVNNSRSGLFYIYIDKMYIKTGILLTRFGKTPCIF